MKEKSYLYKWPLSDDICRIPIQDILMKLNKTYIYTSIYFSNFIK